MPPSLPDPKLAYKAMAEIHTNSRMNQIRQILEQEIDKMGQAEQNGASRVSVLIMQYAAIIKVAAILGVTMEYGEKHDA